MKKSTKKENIYIKGARSEQQLDVMKDIADRGICFMCPENIGEFYTDKGLLIETGKHAFLVHNAYPYENTAHHIMAIPKKHVTKLSQVPVEFWTEVLEMFRKYEEKHHLEGGAMGMRFGEPGKTGATVHHLHAHLIVARDDITPEDKPVRMRMSPYFKMREFDKK